MHDIGGDVRRVEIDATPDRAENRTQRLWAGKITRVEFEANDLEITFLEMLVAKATHFDGDRFCQLPRQITYVHAGAAIDIRRILVSQKQNLHPSLPRLSRVCVKHTISGTGCWQRRLYTYRARTSSTGISTE